MNKLNRHISFLSLTLIAVFFVSPSLASSFSCIVQRAGDQHVKGELPNGSCDFIQGQIGLNGQSDWYSEKSCENYRKRIYELHIHESEIVFGSSNYPKRFKKRIFEGNGGGVSGVLENGPYTSTLIYYPSQNYVVFSSLGNGSAVSAVLSCNEL